MAKISEPFKVDPDKVKGLSGAHNEHRVPGNPKYDRMLAKAKRKGFKQKKDIRLAVNPKGEVHVAKGNTHLAIARALNIPALKAHIEYEDGADKIDGLKRKYGV